MKEWKNKGMKEWRNEGIREWRNVEMKEKRNEREVDSNQPKQLSSPMEIIMVRQLIYKTEKRTENQIKLALLPTRIHLVAVLVFFLGRGIAGVGITSSGVMTLSTTQRQHLLFIPRFPIKIFFFFASSHLYKRYIWEFLDVWATSL